MRLFNHRSLLLQVASLEFSGLKLRLGENLEEPRVNQVGRLEEVPFYQKLSRAACANSERKTGEGNLSRCGSFLQVHSQRHLKRSLSFQNIPFSDENFVKDPFFQNANLGQSTGLHRNEFSGSRRDTHAECLWIAR